MRRRLCPTPPPAPPSNSNNNSSSSGAVLSSLISREKSATINIAHGNTPSRKGTTTLTDVSPVFNRIFKSLLKMDGFRSDLTKHFTALNSDFFCSLFHPVGYWYPTHNVRMVGYLVYVRAVICVEIFRERCRRLRWSRPAAVTPPPLTVRLHPATQHSMVGLTSSQPLKPGISFREQLSPVPCYPAQLVGLTSSQPS